MQSLERGLAVIRAFTEDCPALGITDLAERTGVSRAAVRRILLTLERLGYVRRTEGGLFRLQPAVLSLGYAYIGSQQLVQVGRPYLEKVAQELQGSSSIAVLDGSDVIFVARSRPAGYLAPTFSVGSRFPAHLTAIGRVLLAALPEDQIDTYLQPHQPLAFTSVTVADKDEIRRAIAEARRNGYSFVDQELHIGVRALAVPLHDALGRVCAGLNVTVADPRVSTEEMLDRHLSVLRRVGSEISAGLGSDPF